MMITDGVSFHQPFTFPAKHPRGTQGERAETISLHHRRKLPLFRINRSKKYDWFVIQKSLVMIVEASWCSNHGTFIKLSLTPQITFSRGELFASAAAVRNHNYRACGRQIESSSRLAVGGKKTQQRLAKWLGMMQQNAELNILLFIFRNSIPPPGALVSFDGCCSTRAFIEGGKQITHEPLAVSRMEQCVLLFLDWILMSC